MTIHKLSYDRETKNYHVYTCLGLIFYIHKDVQPDPKDEIEITITN